MKTIGLLPARCGSKTIKLKNIHPVNNQPLLSYTIKALQNSIVDEIYVSTDCDEISNIAELYGAKVIHRPPEISTDESPTIECIKHSINSLKLEDNDTIVLVQPTSPLIESNDITNGIDTFNLGSHSIILSVTETHDILWKESNSGILIPENHNLIYRLRRQEMNKIFKEIGAFYIFKVSNIKQHNSLYGIGNIGYIPISKIKSFQIDDYEDLYIVEQLLKSLQ